MNYSEYISSVKWKATRKRILERDNNHCMLCHSEERLEVHHNSYENLFNESDDDLVTLCRECHERVTNFQRSKRYSKRIHVPEEISTIILRRKEVRHGTTEISLQDTRSSTIDTAQRTTRGPNILIHEGDETTFKQAGENGRGPGGDGTLGMVRGTLCGRRQPGDPRLRH